MKHINLLRGLGIVCICWAATSFLFEGWNNFNGLEKYLIFFGFITTLFALGEAFRKSSDSLDKIFSSLFLALSPAISAQLGSFLIDGDSKIDFPSLFSPSPLPDGSPLKFICITSFIFLVAMMYRSSQRLKSSSPLPDLIYLVTAQLVILVPLRTPEFHAIGLLSIFVSFMLIERNVIFDNIGSVANSLIRLAPFIFLLGRASLYQSNTTLEIATCLIISLLTFVNIPKYFKESSVINVASVIGYISVIVMGHEMANFNLWYKYEWTLIVTEILLMVYLTCFRRSLKIGFFFISILAWFNFLQMAVKSDDLTLLSITLSIALPLAILLLSLSFKYAFGCANSVLLLISALAYLGYQMIKLPVMNMWMVMGVLGIVLLLVSFLIEKPHHKLLQIWGKAKTFFDEEL